MWKLNTHRVPFNSSCCAVFFLLLALASVVNADDSNEQTLRISADDFRGSINGGAVISGNVELTRGSLKLQADNVTLQVENDTFQGIEAKGNPVLLEISLATDEKQRIVYAKAASVIYSITEDQIEFEGDAKVESEEITITGNKIRLDVNENEIEAESLDSDNQVEIILHSLDADKKPTNE